MIKVLDEKRSKSLSNNIVINDFQVKNVAFSPGRAKPAIISQSNGLATQLAAYLLEVQLLADQLLNGDNVA